VLNVCTASQFAHVICCTSMVGYACINWQMAHCQRHHILGRQDLYFSLLEFTSLCVVIIPNSVNGIEVYAICIALILAFSFLEGLEG
jgi:hypothetical protein